MIDIKTEIEYFAKNFGTMNIDLYNEFGLQFELAFYLKGKFSGYKIQLERNVSHFIKNSNTTKKEMDIVIYSENLAERYCIELKFPDNGRYPESMFDCCKDIKFLEELTQNGFNKSCVFMVAKDQLFYSGDDSNIYGYFRGGKTLTGNIQKPTGEKNTSITLKNQYQIVWKNLTPEAKYFIVEVI
ncbi:MAG: hypothetical protein WCJ61_12005 [Paludibacter sp.]